MGLDTLPPCPHNPLSRLHPSPGHPPAWIPDVSLLLNWGFLRTGTFVGSYLYVTVTELGDVLPEKGQRGRPG